MDRLKEKEEALQEEMDKLWSMVDTEIKRLKEELQQ